MKVEISDLEETISGILDDYSADLRNAINSATEKAAQQLRRDIAADAPVGKTGEQKKSWKIAKEKVAVFDLVAIIHSSDYRKVHLLENGHLTRNGVTRTKAIRYISKNEEKIIEQYPRDVAEAIKAVK